MVLTLVLDIVGCIFAIVFVAFFVMIAAIVGGLLYRIYINRIVPWLNKHFGEGMY